MPDSFYGGKAGYSFVITRSFKTVAEMIEQFQKGPAFTEVKYGEYIIIDTVDKNNPDNGSIYQRTANYTDKDTGGAVLLGSIVGPAGPAPHIHIEDYQAVKDKPIPDDNGTEDPYVETGDFTLSIKNASLIPGIDENGEYVTQVDGYFYSERDKATDRDTTVTIGFKVPYTIFDIGATQIPPYGVSKETELLIENPYDYNYYKKDSEGIYIFVNSEYVVSQDVKKYIQNEDGTYTENTEGIYIQDGEEYKLIAEYDTFSKDKPPFYKNYTIQVPHGIHGTDVTSMKTENADIYHPSDDGEFIQLTDGSYFEIPKERYKEVVIDEVTEYELSEDGTFIKLPDNTYIEIPENKYYQGRDFKIIYTLKNYNESYEGSEVSKEIGTDIHFPYRLTYNKDMNILSADYTNETAPKQLGTIDEVKEIKVSEADGYKLLVRFNDSYYKDLKISSTDADPEGFITKDGKSYKVLDGQIYNNLGVVRTTPEFLIGKQLKWGEWKTDSFDINAIITYLNITYSDGFVLTDNNNFYGKSIAVPMEKIKNADCGLFAYDYAKGKWKYLGKLGAQAVTSYIDIQNSSTTINMAYGLANSIILCYEEVDI